MTVKAIRSAQGRGLKFVTIANRTLNVQQQNALIYGAEQRGVQDSPKAIEALVKTLYWK